MNTEIEKLKERLLFHLRYIISKEYKRYKIFAKHVGVTNQTLSAFLSNKDSKLYTIMKYITKAGYSFNVYISNANGKTVYDITSDDIDVILKGVRRFLVNLIKERYRTKRDFFQAFNIEETYTGLNDLSLTSKPSATSFEKYIKHFNLLEHKIKLELNYEDIRQL